MAINVQYGNIADALNLAQMAGKNQGDQQRFKNFTQFADLTQQAQNEINRNNASAIQNSLATDQANQHFQLAQDQLQAENQRSAAQQALAAERSKSEDAYHQQELGIRKTNSDNEAAYHATRADQFQHQQGRLDARDQQRTEGIDALPPDQQAAAKATGRLPYGSQTAGQEDDRRANVLLRQLEFANRRLKDSGYNAQDPNQMLAEPSKTVQGAIAGKEQTFSQANQMIAAAQAEMAMLNQRRQQANAPQSAVQAGTQSLNTAAVVNNAAGGQPTAPQAPQQGPGSQTMPVHVSSAQDYAQLPSGSYYVDPQGQTRQKL